MRPHAFSPILVVHTRPLSGGMEPMSTTYSAPRRQRERAGERDSAVFLKLFSLFAGITIPFVIGIGAWLAISAHGARNEARAAAARATGGAPAAAGTDASSMDMSSGAAAASTAGMRATPSFAGIAPANADALAAARAAFPAELPAAPAGPVAVVDLSIQHRTVTIAPGIKY